MFLGLSLLMSLVSSVDINLDRLIHSGFPAAGPRMNSGGAPQWLERKRTSEHERLKQQASFVS